MFIRLAALKIGAECGQRLSQIDLRELRSQIETSMHCRRNACECCPRPRPRPMDCLCYVVQHP